MNLRLWEMWHRFTVGYHFALDRRQMYPLSDMAAPWKLASALISRDEDFNLLIDVAECLPLMHNLVDSENVQFGPVPQSLLHNRSLEDLQSHASFDPSKFALVLCRRRNL